MPSLPKKILLCFRMQLKNNPIDCSLYLLFHVYTLRVQPSQLHVGGVKGNGTLSSTTTFDNNGEYYPSLTKYA